MKEIVLTIDGKSCHGVLGDTILEVAQKSDVYIPTLCYLKGLTPIGACRMCVVEVEGNPKMLTACTTPAVDGMVVHTKTAKLFSYRKEVLELLFAGRNHFCMFCSQSGDCELQRLAIEHEMDAVRYPYLYADFHNDASHKELQVDHNRCILCLRCIRVCAEKVGAHTLDLEKRGWSANVCADLGKALGESDTCVSCGACAQVCPTGTITIREFAYRGKRNQCDDIVESVCPLCSVGCKIKAYVRTGSVARVEGADQEGSDGGQLCHKGRFWLPQSTERERITVPLIREGSNFREATWEEALDLIAPKLQEAHNRNRAAALVSSLCTDEELAHFSSLFRDSLKLEMLDTFDGDVLRGFMKGFKPFGDQGVRPFTAAHNILDADLVVTVGADPQEEAPVVASYIRVAAIKNGAPMIDLSLGEPPFDALTDHHLPLTVVPNLAILVTELRQAGEASDKGETVLDTYRKLLADTAKTAGVAEDIIEEVVKALVASEKPIFVLGRSLAKSAKMVTALGNLAIASRALFSDGLGLVPLVASGNSLGSINTVVGEKAWLDDVKADFFYTFSTGMIPEEEEALAAISRSRFSVVQTPFWVPPLTNLADVLLPAPAWFERSGHFCTIEGERRRLNVIVPPAAELRGLSAVLEGMAQRLGVKLGRPETAPCVNAFKSEKDPASARMVTL
ncbi:MAG: molybdopterin-dependent oxidoreductase [Synergistaceae bacterium]|nr:molybdopterin-dependent oxidoreductase [Synergistaceae bacterium]